MAMLWIRQMLDIYSPPSSIYIYIFSPSNFPFSFAHATRCGPSPLYAPKHMKIYVSILLHAVFTAALDTSIPPPNFLTRYLSPSFLYFWLKLATVPSLADGTCKRVFRYKMKQRMISNMNIDGYKRNVCSWPAPSFFCLFFFPRRRWDSSW